LTPSLSLLEYKIRLFDRSLLQGPGIYILALTSPPPPKLKKVRILGEYQGKRKKWNEEKNREEGRRTMKGK
jgi:hypothetical protein